MAMRDLVERLRTCIGFTIQEGETIKEAAEEIERLRGALERIKDFPVESYSYESPAELDMRKIAREALENTSVFKKTD